MLVIQPSRQLRFAPHRKQVRGGMRQSESGGDEHPSLANGKEPELIRQGRRNGASSEAPAKVDPPPTSTQLERAGQRLRWQSTGVADIAT